MIELLPIYTLRITGRRKKSLEARKAQFRQTVDRIIRFEWHLKLTKKV